MTLTENEKRDIIRCLESDKPLPDKYRFLLFADKKEVELVWNGKTSDVSTVVLPFQTIEVVDEPRAENTADTKKRVPFNLFDFDDRGRQISGWTNKLIWGDNKLILSSLRSGVMREEIEKQGGLKLIYIDPPFDVGADFSMKVEIGDDQLTKKPNVLEELAYRDTWGKGADSYIAMIYERLSLMRNLLSEDGSIYVHCDWRVVHYLRSILDEIFGKEYFLNQIEWGYKTGGIPERIGFSKKHDHILFYSRSHSTVFNKLLQKSYVPTLPEPHTDSGKRLEVQRDDVCELCRSGSPGQKYRMVITRDIWDDIASIFRNDMQATGYATQKPEALLERIIKASSSEGDLVADFFCGSGTTLVVSEKLGRKWIGSDLGKFAIHTTRKRMIGVQREMKASGKNFRAFEILNLGKYERQHYIGVNPDLREQQKAKQLAKKEKDFVNLIIRAYKAEGVVNFTTLVAKKAGRLVAVGPIDLPASRLFVQEVIKECSEKQMSKVDILAFEFEMGLVPKIQDEAKERGIDLALKYIPREVFDKRAVEKNQIAFHDVSYIEVKPHLQYPPDKGGKGGKSGGTITIAIELTDFSVYYNQDIVDNVIVTFKKGADKILVEQGKIIKKSKDKDDEVTREVLTKEWSDWIDYWAVDFDFESKKELVRVKNENGEIEEAWTGDYIFENEWQSFRTKKNRSIELKSVAHECLGKKGRRKIAVKVVDIFGNDTMKVIEVTI